MAAVLSEHFVHLLGKLENFSATREAEQTPDSAQIP